MYSCLERSVLRVKSGRSSHHEALDLTDVVSKAYISNFRLLGPFFLVELKFVWWGEK